MVRPISASSPTNWRFWYLEERFAQSRCRGFSCCSSWSIDDAWAFDSGFESPYAKRGVLWDVFSRHYGPGGAANILVAKGTTRDFNPTISKEEIDALLAEDPVRNASEYLAEFRGDIIESFISLDAVESCIGDYHELAPSPNISYFCYVDPALAAAARTVLRQRITASRRHAGDSPTPCGNGVPPFQPGQGDRRHCRVVQGIQYPQFCSAAIASATAFLPSCSASTT